MYDKCIGHMICVACYLAVPLIGTLVTAGIFSTAGPVGDAAIVHIESAAKAAPKNNRKK